MARLQLRLTEAEKERLRGLAREAGLTVPDCVRRRCGLPPSKGPGRPKAAPGPHGAGG